MRRFGPTFESYFLLFDLIKEELKEDDDRTLSLCRHDLSDNFRREATFSDHVFRSSVRLSIRKLITPPPHRRFLDQCQTYIYLILFSGEDLYRCANSDCDFAASNVSSFKVSLHFCSETKFLRVE